MAPPLPGTPPTLLRGVADHANLKRDAPRIAGSEAGFIAVVVGLAVIILASCIAIFILTRDPDPSRAPARREPHPRSLAATVRSLFSRRPAPSGHGWIQASGDAWEADEADRREMQYSVPGPPALDQPFRPPANTDPYARPTTISPSDSYSYSGASARPSVPRSASPESTVTRASASTSMSRSLHPARVRPESAITGSDWEAATSRGHAHAASDTDASDAEEFFDAHDAHDADADPHDRERSTSKQQRHFSVESAASGTSVRTFEGGTKFLEGL
ncbi:hypothetical protein B0H11DRAFT_2277971 [Mycena galericulata]|nr:hypothetical protein B0H11DRAFT_2277971 [Mycena galericulata]